MSLEVSAVKFRTNCFKILDAVHRTHKEVVITKRGKPVAKLVCYKEMDKPDPLVGVLAGAGETMGELTEPFDDAWELD